MTALQRVLEAHREHVREHGVDAPGFDLTEFVEVELDIMSDGSIHDALERRERISEGAVRYWNALIEVRALL